MRSSSTLTPHARVCSAPRHCQAARKSFRSLFTSLLRRLCPTNRHFAHPPRRRNYISTQLRCWCCVRTESKTANFDYPFCWDSRNPCLPKWRPLFALATFAPKITIRSAIYVDLPNI